MIIEPIKVTEKELTFNRLTHTEPYYAVGCMPDSLQIVLMSPSETEPQLAGSKTDSLLTGFGSDSWVELNEEIRKRGLEHPNL